MIRRSFFVETDTGGVTVSRAATIPTAVSIKQGSDHILMETWETARDLRDALTELLAEMVES